MPGRRCLFISNSIFIFRRGRDSVLAYTTTGIRKRRGESHDALRISQSRWRNVRTGRGHTEEIYLPGSLANGERFRVKRRRDAWTWHVQRSARSLSTNCRDAISDSVDETEPEPLSTAKRRTSAESGLYRQNGKRVTKENVVLIATVWSVG